MVEHMALAGVTGQGNSSSSTDSISNIFQALADSTRRDILTRVAKKEMSISEIKERYGISFAAIAKHVNVLVRANLVTKRRQGREQYVTMIPSTVKTAEEVLAHYQKIWEQRFDNLDTYLNKIQKEGK